MLTPNADEIAHAIIAAARVFKQDPLVVAEGDYRGPKAKGIRPARQAVVLALYGCWGHASGYWAHKLGFSSTSPAGWQYAKTARKNGALKGIGFRAACAAMLLDPDEVIKRIEARTLPVDAAQQSKPAAKPSPVAPSTPKPVARPVPNKIEAKMVPAEPDGRSMRPEPVVPARPPEPTVRKVESLAKSRDRIRALQSMADRKSPAPPAPERIKEGLEPFAPYQMTAQAIRAARHAKRLQKAGSSLSDIANTLKREFDYPATPDWVARAIITTLPGDAA